MRFVLSLLLLMSGSAFASDATLADQRALQDAHLLQKLAHQDLVLDRRQLSPQTVDSLQKMFAKPIVAFSDDCNPGGAGSAACWKACENEGYASATCAPRCGVTTEAGSAECWKGCEHEGYSSSTCAPRCGIATDAGSAECWKACENEGYSSATCAPRCGVGTDGGSAECWKTCQTEGYSSATCAPRCGAN